MAQIVELLMLISVQVVLKLEVHSVVKNKQEEADNQVLIHGNNTWEDQHVQLTLVKKFLLPKESILICDRLCKLNKHIKILFKIKLFKKMHFIKK
jgi:hypothetical protein